MTAFSKNFVAESTVGGLTMNNKLLTGHGIRSTTKFNRTYVYLSVQCIYHCSKNVRKARRKTLLWLSAEAVLPGGG